MTTIWLPPSDGDMATDELLARLGPQPRGLLQDLLALLDPLVLVGGSVRDLCLGRPVHDIDLVVPSDGLAQARRIANTMGGAYVALDTARNTGRALITTDQGGSFTVDVASWRGPSLLDDLRGRDFTLNAVAICIARGRAALLDPTGGLRDLAARQLRLTSAQALVDDPLRSLRGVRLAAELRPWGFRLQQDTAGEIRRAAARVTASSWERIRDELVRIVAAPDPQRSLQLLAELELLPVVLPEAAALTGVQQSAPHVYDVETHTGWVVNETAWLADFIAGQAALRDEFDATAATALGPFQPALAAHLSQTLGSVLGTRANALRWAALSHDWGKPATRSVELAPDSAAPRVRFLGHDAVSASLVEAAMQRLHFSDAETRWVASIAGAHMRPHALAAGPQPPSARSLYRFFRDVQAASVDTTLLSLADLRATAGPTLRLDEWGRQVTMAASLLDAYFHQANQLVRPVPLLTGHDLIAKFQLQPGPQIGHILADVLEAQATGDVQTREQALAYAAKMV